MNEKKALDQLIGSNIKRERQKAGYTQEQFSELIGIGSKSLSAIERGTVGISLSALVRICNALSVSPNSLLFENSSKNNVQDITDCLERLTPEQLAVTHDILHSLFKSFSAK